MIRLVDVRPREEYLAGHVPGAVHLDPERDLTGDLGGGRHPLPRPERFAEAASRAGIGDDTFVLALDDGDRLGRPPLVAAPPPRPRRMRDVRPARRTPAR